MIQEFKEFIDRGNVVDLAVAVVIGAAFGQVVVAFTDGILMQLVAAIVGEPDFSGLTFDLGDAVIQYGLFVTALINFLLIAFAVFLVVKAINSARKPEEVEAAVTDIDLLTEIRDELRARNAKS